MEPNFFAHSDAIQQGLLLQSSAEISKKDLESKKPAGGVPHQQIVCKNEKREEAPALAMVIASASPTHSSAEDIFSDTMELASYLHRRVQEIGKQFRHRPFRIHTSEKLELIPGFLQGLSCVSGLSLGSATAKAFEPGELATLCENTESCLREGASLPEVKPSCFSNRDLSACAEMKERTIFNLYDNGFGGGKALNTEMKGRRTNDSRPNEGRACNSEEAFVLSLPHREEKLPFSSENACDSVCLSQRKGEDAPSNYREGNLPILSENACVSMCHKRGLHIQESVMCDQSPKRSGFQKGENLNMCLDAASCPPLGCTEGNNPHSQCSTPSHDSSEHLQCHAPSDTEHLSSDLKLPSLQDHVISDAEDAGVLPRLQMAERDFGNPEHSSSCVVGSQMPCYAGLRGGPVLSESVRQQGSIHAHIMHSQQAVAENSSLHSNVRHSMSSVDSSECDNCGTDADKGCTLTMRAGLRNSNGDDGYKSEEIDAMGGAMHLDTRRKGDENGTTIALGGGTSGKAESKSDALDLLLDAIQVTSAEDLVAKEGADVCSPSSSHPKKPRRNGGKSLEERKQSSLAQMFQTTKKVSDQARNSPELLSDTLSLYVGFFPIVRKRSNRCRKTLVTEEPSPSGNSVSPVVRFKSLHAVSEVNLPSNRKDSKKLAANKQDGKKVERGKIFDSSQSCLNGKRERTWEKQQDSLGKEDCYRKQEKQEKREKFTDGDDLNKDRGKEQLPAIPSSEGDEEEQGMLSRRARLQILPTKFSDSVLQPWKKGDRRRS